MQLFAGAQDYTPGHDFRGFREDSDALGERFGDAGEAGNGMRRCMKAIERAKVRAFSME
jgi:hypothetical protein